MVQVSEVCTQTREFAEEIHDYGEYCKYGQVRQTIAKAYPWNKQTNKQHPNSFWPHCDKARATLASSSCCGVHNTYISTFISRQTQFSPKFLLRMFYQLLCSFYLINCTGERLYDWGNFFFTKDDFICYKRKLCKTKLC